MKSFVVLSVLMIASSGCAASAAESSYADYSDIDVVSVVPRNSNVKPYVMATFTKQQLERVAAAAPKKSRPVRRTWSQVDDEGQLNKYVLRALATSVRT